MAQELHYTIFHTTAGWLGITGTPNGLLRLTLPRHSPEETRQLLGDCLSRAIQSPRMFQDLILRLNDYFTGHKTSFPDKLDLSGASTFQRLVWDTTRRIPYGETRSYAWVAAQMAQPKAARAVGQALGKNPLPVIIPCHRVLSSDGRLGGFSGGLWMKQYLLHLEGSEVLG